jgi:hypothetical protein
MAVHIFLLYPPTTDLLERDSSIIASAYSERKPELIQQAENLTQHLFQSNQFGINKPAEQGIFENDSLEDDLFKPDEERRPG